MNVWPFPPQREMRERIEWETEVIRCRAGEQRICLRPAPRTTMEMDFQFLPGEIEAATMMAREWGASEFLLPFWHELTHMGNLFSGDPSLSLDTTQKRYKTGGLLFVMGRDGSHEVVEIASVSSSGILLESPYLTQDHEGAVIMPCWPARFSSPFGFEKYSADYLTGSAEFMLTADFGISGSNPYPTFGDSYVVTDRPLAVSSSKETHSREFEVFSNLAGPLFYSTLYNYPVGSSTMTWSFDTPEQVWAFRRWMYEVKGKQGSFFMPRWTRDWVLFSTASDTSDFIVVEKNGYMDAGYTGPICVLKKDGTTLFFNILGTVSTGEDTETLYLDTPLGETLLPEDVEMITRMPRMRFNSDRIEFKHNTGGSVDVRLPVMEVPE